MRSIWVEAEHRRLGPLSGMAPERDASRWDRPGPRDWMVAPLGIDTM
jgi:hypothetical protein